MYRVAGMVFLLVCVGCSNGSSTPTIVNASSESAFGDSLDKIKNELSDDENRRFDAALLIISIDIKEKTERKEQPGDTSQSDKLWADLIGGKNASEIVEIARKIKEANGSIISLD